MQNPISDRLLRENEELCRRLGEAEDTIRALRAGEVDAILVEAADQVYTLEEVGKPYRLLVEQLPQGAAILDVEGTILHCNRHFADFLKQPLPALPGKPILDFIAPDSRPLLETLLHNGLAAEVQGEVTLKRADHTSVPSYLGVRALREGALGVCLMVTDLTEQRHYQELKQARDALRTSELKFDTALSSIKDCVYMFDRDERVVYANKVLLDLWGLSRDQVFGNTMMDLCQPVEVLGEFRRNVREVFDTGSAVMSVTPFTSLTGAVGAYENIFTPMPDESGGVALVVGVSRDITERLRVEAALKDADRKKDEFLAILAHELRNPLAPISNAVHILGKSQTGQEMEWCRTVLNRQVKVMSRLLEDLLDMSRISRNKLVLRKERVALAGVLEAAIETSTPVIDSGGHELTVTAPAEPIYLEADSVRLAQVFANLLNNAAKYTEDGGRIWLNVERQAGEVLVRVRDSGIGISAEMMPQIFELFSQSKRSLELAQGGLGIGLALVKGLVSLHGGSIEARSDGAGRGSEFTIHLPLAARATVAESIRPGTEDAVAPIAKYRVLIVDDNRDSADSLTKLLRIMGNDVETAYDGEQAVAAAAEFQPDIMLLDIGMPKLNGYETCARIRELPGGPDIFMVAVTGWGQEHDRRRTQAAGFNQHMVKPVDPADLVKVLTSLSVE